MHWFESCIVSCIAHGGYKLFRMTCDLHQYISLWLVDSTLEDMLLFVTDQKRNRVIQLIGAITMLALLGVPWIFSVFGVIDGNLSRELAVIEGIFQVISQEYIVCSL